MFTCSRSQKGMEFLLNKLTWQVINLLQTINLLNNLLLKSSLQNSYKENSVMGVIGEIQALFLSKAARVVREVKALEGKDYLCGDVYTIADIMHFKWTSGLIGQDFLNGASYKNLQRWAKSIENRPAVKRGLRVLGWGDDAVKERHSRADVV